MKPSHLAGPSIALCRAVFCVLLIAPWVRFRELGPRGPVLALCISFTTMSVAFITAMTRADAGVAIFLQYTAPIWVLLFERIRGGVSMARRELLALAAATGGVGVIVASGGAGGDIVGLLLALGAGLGFAGVILSLRAMAGSHGLSSLFLANISIAAVVAFWLVGAVIVPVGEQWAWLGGLALIQYATPYALFAVGLG